MWEKFWECKSGQCFESRIFRFVIFTVVVLAIILITISLIRSNRTIVDENLPTALEDFREEIIFDDIKIKLNQDIFSHEQFQAEIKEINLINFLNKNLKKGDTIICVSWDIGVEQLLMAKIISQSGKIYSFNPIEKYSKPILLSAKTNGFESRIVIHPIAISNKTFDGLLVYKNGKGEFEGVLRDADFEVENGDNAIKVKVSTLDDYCSQLQNINFLRIGVKNISEVIKGAEKLISRSPQIKLIVDFDKDKCEAKEGLKWLSEHGFKIYLLNSENLKEVKNIEETEFVHDILIIKRPY